MMFIHLKFCWIKWAVVAFCVFLVMRNMLLDMMIYRFSKALPSLNYTKREIFFMLSTKIYCQYHWNEKLQDLELQYYTSNRANELELIDVHQLGLIDTQQTSNQNTEMQIYHEAFKNGCVFRYFYQRCHLAHEPKHAKKSIIVVHGGGSAFVIMQRLFLKLKNIFAKDEYAIYLIGMKYNTGSLFNRIKWDGEKEKQQIKDNISAIKKKYKGQCIVIGYSLGGALVLDSMNDIIDLKTNDKIIAIAPAFGLNAFCKRFIVTILNSRFINFLFIIFGETFMACCTSMLTEIQARENFMTESYARLMHDDVTNKKNVMILNCMNDFIVCTQRIKDLAHKMPESYYATVDCTHEDPMYGPSDLVNKIADFCV